MFDMKSTMPSKKVTLTKRHAERIATAIKRAFGYEPTQVDLNGKGDPADIVYFSDDFKHSVRGEGGYVVRITLFDSEPAHGAVYWNGADGEEADALFAKYKLRNMTDINAFLFLVKCRYPKVARRFALPPSA